ncbi:MAG: ATP-binding protein, partial [Pseudomonadales bacterium]
GVAHDFNNILSAILGYTELTRTQLARQPQATDYLDKLESSVNRAKEIVASVLAFGRAQQLPLEMINLSTVMDDALHLVRPIVPANVRLVEDIEPAQVPVLANPSQITQILLNLCTNACQAMAEDGGTLQVSLRNQNINRAQARESGKLQSGPHLRICVADTGKGMDEYTVARIFEPFFTTQPAGRGSGLGLSVVHGVVSQIGGTIEVSSTPESGSRFEIIVPCMSGEEMPDTDTGAVTSQAATGTETILFVDDEADLAHVAKLGLGQMGYSVITADNGAEALALLEQHIVHMIVTDQTMPVMRGEELAEQVKQKYPDIPILLISGADQPEAETVDGFLTKPYTIAELAAKIRTMMATAPRSA